MLTFDCYCCVAGVVALLCLGSWCVGVGSCGCGAVAGNNNGLFFEWR